MKSTNPNIRYRVRHGQNVPDDMHSYTVEEWNGNILLRTFAVLISQSHRLAHTPAESYFESSFIFEESANAFSDAFIVVNDQNAFWNRDSDIQ